MPFTPKEPNRCKRCNGAVYDAEQRKDSSGGYWHKRCYTCKNCADNKKNTKLDSTNCCDNAGNYIWPVFKAFFQQKITVLFCNLLRQQYEGLLCFVGIAWFKISSLLVWHFVGKKCFAGGGICNGTPRGKCVGGVLAGCTTEVQNSLPQPVFI